MTATSAPSSLTTDPGAPPRCLLCGGPTVARFRSPAIWYERPAQRAFGLFECPCCDFTMFWPRPSPEESRRFYHEHYYTHQLGSSTKAPTEDSPGAWDRLRERVAWRLDLGRSIDAPALAASLGPPPARFCDIGCGNGALMDAVRALGHEVVGVEPDDQARAVAESRGLEVHAGAAERLPIEVQQQRFDVVTFIHVLEHCLDPVRALEQGAALVRPGGSLVVEVPNHGALTARQLGPAWWHCDPGRHVNFFTLASLTRLFQAAGLRPYRAGYHGFFRQFTTDRLRDERSVVQVYREVAGEDAIRPFHSPTAWGVWGQMLRASLATPDRKYEAIHLIARVAGAPATIPTHH